MKKLIFYTFLISTFGSAQSMLLTQADLATISKNSQTVQNQLFQNDTVKKVHNHAYLAAKGIEQNMLNQDMVKLTGKPDDKLTIAVEPALLVCCLQKKVFVVANVIPLVNEQKIATSNLVEFPNAWYKAHIEQDFSIRDEVISEIDEQTKQNIETIQKTFVQLNYSLIDAQNTDHSPTELYKCLEQNAPSPEVDAGKFSFYTYHFYKITESSDEQNIQQTQNMIEKECQNFINNEKERQKTVANLNQKKAKKAKWDAYYKTEQEKLKARQKASEKENKIIKILLPITLSYAGLTTIWAFRSELLTLFLNPEKAIIVYIILIRILPKLLGC